MAARQRQLLGRSKNCSNEPRLQSAAERSCKDTKPPLPASMSVSTRKTAGGFNSCVNVGGSSFDPDEVSPPPPTALSLSVMRGTVANVPSRREPCDGRSATRSSRRGRPEIGGDPRSCEGGALPALEFVQPFGDRGVTADQRSRERLWRCGSGRADYDMTRLWSDCRKSIRPRFSRQRLANLRPCFTSQRARALAFISRSTSV